MEAAAPSLQDEQLLSGGGEEASLGLLPGSVLAGIEHHPDGGCMHACVPVCVCIRVCAQAQGRMFSKGKCRV